MFSKVEISSHFDDKFKIIIRAANWEILAIESLAWSFIYFKRLLMQRSDINIFLKNGEFEMLTSNIIICS